MKLIPEISIFRSLTKAYLRGDKFKRIAVRSQGPGGLSTSLFCLEGRRAMAAGGSRLSLQGASL